MADVQSMPDVRSSPYTVNSSATHEPSSASPKRRQDFSKEKVKEDELRLGEYVLGQTLGEGEFGKVKLGWKKHGGAQVAIKIIRRRKLDTQSRLAKVFREIAILRQLEHPNIVKLYETVETTKTIGMVLEYASGGELFDYILHHRYLRDNSARRLFAQLVSGVGYLHRKGIIHRDLKLENLLLDRNKNIIITDFGFANTFDPNDELSSEDEANLHRKDYVKDHGLEDLDKRGFRRGDLMMTSCGSPCYAAPELVVSDGLYTGRKVDVWSCGVILYAMLAGYLPFDDDPRNPEGDNINALYQYIINTPLVFPEYVTPHARDLLKRILVPKPRERADLFEIARHSWLAEYASILESITSSVASPIDTIFDPPIDNDSKPPVLNRSASVRDVVKPQSAPGPSASPGLSRKNEFSHLQQDDNKKSTPTPRDAKRRTVQLEYVAPHSTTSRPEGANDNGLGYGGTDDGPAVPEKDYYPATKSKFSQRPGRDVPRSISDSTAFNGASIGTRPSTGGSMTATRMPSYGQPVAANVTATNAQGRFSQPPRSAGGKQYMMSPNADQQDTYMGEATADHLGGAGGFNRQQDGFNAPPGSMKGHKRSNTLGGLGDKIMRAGSLSRRRPKTDRMYPPSSMRPIPNDSEQMPLNSRPSTESRRSFGFGRKSSDLGPGEKRHSRRFSFIPRYKSRSSQAELRNDLPSNDSAMENYPQEKKSGIFWRNNRRFNEAYDEHHGGEAGSSGAARRVMEFFRRRR